MASDAATATAAAPSGEAVASSSTSKQPAFGQSEVNKAGKKRKAGDQLRRSDDKDDQDAFFAVQSKQFRSHLNVISGKVMIPQKRWYRQRAHANPFSDHMLQYPPSPADMDWSTHFPDFVEPQQDDQADPALPPRLKQPVRFADIGCGFGGLLMDLAPIYPDTLMIGMEIRTMVTQYVFYKIVALRMAARQAHGEAIEGLPVVQGEGTEGNEEAEGQVQQESDAQPEQPISKRKAKRLRKEAAKKAKLAETPAGSDEEEDEENEKTINEALVKGAGDIAGGYKNISAIRANCMKFLPNFFGKGQVRRDMT